ncbi:MAG: RnfABCDGE type electron transport complex subunit C [Bacilli bacterium]
MGIFTAKGHVVLPGHKEETKNKQPLIYSLKAEEKVYLPLVNPRGLPNQVLVKVGDTIKKGQKVMLRTDFYVPLYAPVSGVVLENEKRYNAVTGRPTDHLVIAANGSKEVAKNQFLKGDYQKATRQEVIEAIKEAGIVGLGGAGFPTFIKYQTDKPIECVLINGVECEPYLTTDYLAMKEYVHKVVVGTDMLVKAGDAPRAIIAIKVKKEPLPELYKEALIDFPHITLVEVPDLYPMGWEKRLVKEVFNRTYEKLPIECGVIINNSQTAIAVFDALTNGQPITEKLITVAGDGVVNPTNILVPVGLPVCEIIAACGGYLGDEITLIAGGPMTGKPISNDDFVIQTAMNGLTVLKPLKHSAQFVDCLRCGDCTAHCPAHLQPVEIKRALDRRDFDHLEKLRPFDCVECGICSYVCPSKLEITDAVRRAKTMLQFHLNRKAKK